MEYGDTRQFAERGGLCGPVARRDYREFIATKRIASQSFGFETPWPLNDNLMPWQAKIVHWLLRRGRGALFAGTGLGKTFMQLVYGEHVVRHTGRPALLVCPLGVRLQTVHEAERFGIAVDVHIADSQSDVTLGINVTNYDKVDHFDPREFDCIILDESSILKGLTSATRRKLTEMFGNTPYRLACTATPSPNDHMELGNHSEWLGVMQSIDMLSRFFYHDSGNTSQWAIMPHGSRDFWEWVASWAVCIGMPSDIGGDDAGYILPPLRTHRCIAELQHVEPPEGFLFPTTGISATTIHEEKRQTLTDRCEMAASIVRQEDSPCVVWCDTNDEADMLVSLLPEAIEIRGNHTIRAKEENLDRFASGQAKWLISKPSICGFGLNWQHCHRMVFAGLTYSFEAYYQAVRRCWRFGQTQPVDVYIVIAETESAIQSAIARKETDFDAMRSGMAEAMKDATLAQFGLDKLKQDYQPAKAMALPPFLGAMQWK